MALTKLGAAAARCEQAEIEALPGLVRTFISELTLVSLSLGKVLEEVSGTLVGLSCRWEPCGGQECNLEASSPDISELPLLGCLASPSWAVHYDGDVTKCASQPVQSGLSAMASNASNLEPRRNSFSVNRAGSVAAGIRLTHLLHHAEVAETEKRRIGTLQDFSAGCWRRFRAIRLDTDLVDTLIDTVITPLIVINAVVIGMGCDADQSWTGWLWFDLIFCVFFLVELALRLVVIKPCYFFCGPGMVSNIFDLSIVVLDSAQLILTVVASREDGGGSSLKVLRFVRLVRLGRIVRILRVSFFRELLVMMNGMRGGFTTLIWSMFLVACPIYVIAIFTRETLGRQQHDLALYFASVPRSMLTILRCSFGECNTIKGTPVFEEAMQFFGWGFGLFYGIFAFVITIGLFNVISAMYVERVISASNADEQSQKSRRLADEHLLASRIAVLTKLILESMGQSSKRMSQKVDTIMSLEVTMEVFKTVISDPVAASALDDLDIPREDHLNLFDILDSDKSGGLHFEELLVGIEKLRGEPRRSDLVAMDLMVRSMLSKVDEILELLSQMDERKVCAIPHVPFYSNANGAL